MSISSPQKQRKQFLLLEEDQHCCGRYYAVEVSPRSRRWHLTLEASVTEATGHTCRDVLYCITSVMSDEPANRADHRHSKVLKFSTISYPDPSLVGYLDPAIHIRWDELLQKMLVGAQVMFKA